MSENSENPSVQNVEESGEEFQSGSAFPQEPLSKPIERPTSHRDPSLHDSSMENSPANLGMLLNVNLQLTVELGRTNMSVRQVLDLQKGAVVELERIAGEAVDVYVNDRLIARGDVVVVDDKFGVRITELINPNPVG